MMHLLRRLFCRHPNLQPWRRGFYSEGEPYQIVIARWCPDCMSVVLVKRRRR